jgi:hypothetical protein
MLTRSGLRHASGNQVPALRTPVTIGSRFGDWEVTWLGGWTQDRRSAVERSRERVRVQPVAGGLVIGGADRGSRVGVYPELVRLL